MKRIALWTLGFVLASGGALAQAPSFPLQTPEAEDLLTRMMERGWEIVAPDVLQLRHADGSLETLAFGRAGFEREIEVLRARQERAQQRFVETGHVALLNRLSEIEEQIRSVEMALEHADFAETLDGPADRELHSLAGLMVCTTQIDRSATAGVGKTGPQATAHASFSDSCGALGQPYAHAEAEGWQGTQFNTASQTDQPPSSTGSGSADAFASVVADTDCFSYAFARVRLRDDAGVWTTWTAQDTNTSCPAPSCQGTETDCDDCQGGCSITCGPNCDCSGCPFGIGFCSQNGTCLCLC